MSRHAVHLTAVKERAWQSARCRKTWAVVLEIDAEGMYNQGYVFGVSENKVWCTDTIPVQFVVKFESDKCDYIGPNRIDT